MSVVNEYCLRRHIAQEFSFVFAIEKVEQQTAVKIFLVFLINET